MPVACIALTRASRFLHRIMPQSYGEFSVLWASTDHESAFSIPCVRKFPGSGPGCPKTEGPVNMNPGACRSGALTDLVERVESARIDVTCLRDHQAVTVQCGHFVCAACGPGCPPVPFPRGSLPSPNNASALNTDACACAPTITRRFGAPNRPSAFTSQPWRFSSSLRAAANPLQGCGGRAADEPGGRASRQAKQVNQPFFAGGFQLGGNGRCYVHTRILIPHIRKPFGSQGSRNRAAINKAKVPSASLRNGRRRSIFMQQVKNFCRVTRSGWQGFIKNFQVLDGLIGRIDIPFTDTLHVSICMRFGLFEKYPWSGAGKTFLLEDLVFLSFSYSFGFLKRPTL